MPPDAPNSKPKEKAMIDAREEVASSAAKTSPRRTAATAPARATKPGAAKKGLRLERVFSDATIKPFDQLE